MRQSIEVRPLCECAEPSVWHDPLQCQGDAEHTCQKCGAHACDHCFIESSQQCMACYFKERKSER